MATRKDQVQISIAFLTDESKQYAKLITDNQKFIKDIQEAKKQGKDLSQVIRDMAKSGNEISKIPLDKVAPTQLISRARQLKQVLDLIPQSAPEYKALEAEYKTLNDQLAEMRARSRGVAEGMGQLRTEGGLLTRILTTAVGVLGGLNLQGLFESAKQYVVRLFDIGTALDAAQAKTRTVFGDAEVVVKGFAEANARSLGLARQEYVDLATAAGDLLKPMGFTESAVANLSVSLTDQAGILAEWSKGKVNTEQASEILTKSLLGERDALNTLGIDIKDSLIQDEIKKKGLQDLTGASRRQAEALITMEQITKQSASANEAYAKNTDSLTRRKAELRARIAEVSTTAARLLIPVFSLAINVGLKLVDWGVRFAQTLAAIPAFVRDNQVALAALTVGLVTMNGNAILAAANTLRLSVAQRAAAIATTAQAAAQRVLNLVLTANPIGLVVTALSFLVAGLAAAWQNSETFRRVVTGVFAAVTASAQNAIGFFSDLGSGLKSLFEGNFQAAADSFAASFKRVNPAQIGVQLATAYKAGYDSVPAPKAAVQGDAPAAEAEGSKVGQALANGFDGEFAKLKASGERGADALTKAAKTALDAQLKELEAGLLKEELVADKALADRTIKEDFHAKVVLDLKRQYYEDQIAIFKKFNQEESKEALEAQRKLLEIQQQRGPRRVAGLAPLATRGPGPVTSQTSAGLKAADVSAADDELKILRDKFALAVDAEQEHELLRAEMLRNSLDARLEFLRTNGLTETQIFQQTLDAKLKADEDYSKKRIENEERTAALKKQVEEASIAATADVFGIAIELLSQDEKARKKNAGVIKAFQTAQVIVQGISEVQKIWSHAADLGPIAGPIIGAIQTGVAVVRTGLAISKINSAKFAGGGFTGFGFGPVDSTGHRPVGTVHEREWVAPRWMVESPAFAPTISALETVRRRGFADGGYSTTPSPSVTGVPLPGVDQNMMQAFSLMSTEIAGLRRDVNGWRTRLKADVVYTDVEDAGSELNLVRDDASF